MALAINFNIDQHFNSIEYLREQLGDCVTLKVAKK